MNPIAPKLTLILGDHPRFLYQLGAGAGPEPNGAGLERGTLPSPWITGGPGSAKVPKESGLRLQHGSLHRARIRLYQLRKAVPLLFLRQGPCCCSWCRSQRDQCRRNSESNGRGVVRPEGPPVDPDLRRAISQGRDDRTPQIRDLPENTVWRRFCYPWSSADGLRYPAVAHRDWRHRCWRARDLDVAIAGTIPSASPSTVCAPGSFSMATTWYPGRLYVHEFPAFGATIQRLVDLT